jgi:hypothetical protein
MPGGDKTGPAGKGPMTGRRAGICAGFDHFANSGVASLRGFASGVGHAGWFRRTFGRHGRRIQYFASGRPGWLRAQSGGGPSAPPTDREALRQRLHALESESAAIKKQLVEME